MMTKATHLPCALKTTVLWTRAAPTTNPAPTYRHHHHRQHHRQEDFFPFLILFSLFFVFTWATMSCFGIHFREDMQYSSRMRPENEVSYASEANIEIEKVLEILTTMTILHGDIETNDNFADIGTRSHEQFPLEEQQRKAEQTPLRVKETLINFVSTRRRIFMRERMENDPELNDDMELNETFSRIDMDPFDDDDNDECDELDMKRYRTDERCNGMPHGA